MSGFFSCNLGNGSKDAPMDKARTGLQQGMNKGEFLAFEGLLYIACEASQRPALAAMQKIIKTSKHQWSRQLVL